MSIFVKQRFVFVLPAILLACFFTFFNKALSQTVNTRLYTINDGLSQSSVFSAYEDRSGYLWIGSSNGISRFDGQKFKHYGLSEGLPSPEASAVFEDTKNRLWIATRAGMARVVGDTVVTYPIADDNRVIHYQFGFAELRSGAIWALTDVGVYQFDDSIWRKITLRPENDYTRQVVETDSGLYVNFGSTLAFRDLNNKWTVIEEHKPNELYFNVMSLYNGKVLVSTRHSILEIRNNHLVPITENLKGFGFFSYFFDNDERLWYCFAFADSFLHVSEPGDTKNFRSILRNDYGIITNLSQDSHGNIWVGTQYGLLKINIASFTRLPETLGTKDLSNILPLKDSGVLVTGALGFGVYFYNKLSDKFECGQKGKTKIELIDCYTYDNEGNTWMFSHDMNIYKFNGKVFQKMPRLKNLRSREDFFTAVYDKSNQRFIICGDSTVLAGRLDSMGYLAASTSGKEILGYSTVLSTMDDKILLYIPQKGIYQIKGANELVPVYSLRDKRNVRFSALLYEDRKQNIWVADEYVGLLCFRFNEQGRLVILDTISKKDGLMDNRVYSMASDVQNRLWVVTSLGIDIIQQQRKDWIVFNYSKYTSLSLNNQFAKLISDSEGNIWLNDWEKIIRFKTDEIVTKNETPDAIIEKIQLNSEDVEWSKYTDSLSGYDQFPIDPVIDYEKNSVTFHFNGITYSSSPRLEYSYELYPTDTTWSQPIQTSSVTFIKLRPGHYQFKVRTRDRGSHWSEPSSFTFTIKTPFWMEWWFITLCALLFIGLVYGIYRYRINQLKKLLAIRSKISRDLHDEVGSTLTSINILSKVSRNQLEKDHSRASELLQKITEQSENMQQSMSDIVWSIKPDNDRMENLLVRMREYLNQTADAKGVQVELNADEKALKEQLSMQQRHNVFLIFKEAVNNSVKYSNAENIKVYLGKKGSQMILSVEDDGIGFEQMHVSSSNGLRNMQSRASELGAAIEIHSLPGKGTQITLYCPTT